MTKEEQGVYNQMRLIIITSPLKTEYVIKKYLNRISRKAKLHFDQRQKIEMLLMEEFKIK